MDRKRHAINGTQSLLQKGFTTTELIVVIGILAILMAMVGTGLEQLLRSRNIQSNADRVASQIAMARQLAISRNRIVHVRFVNESESRQGVEIYFFADATSKLSGVDDWKTATAGPGMTITRGVHFDTDGNPDPSAADLDYSSAGAKIYGALYFWPDGSAGQAVRAGEKPPLPRLELEDSAGQVRYIEFQTATGRVEIRNPEVQP